MNPLKKSRDENSPPPPPYYEFPRTHGFREGEVYIELAPISPSSNPYQITVEPNAPPLEGGGSLGSALERSYLDMVFNTTAGFSLKYHAIGPALEPIFTVRSNHRTNGLLVPSGSNIDGKFLTKYCSSSSWEAVKFSKSGQEWFHFLYKPNYFCGRRSRFVHVYDPGHAQRIGSIKIKPGAGAVQKAAIFDFENNRRFSTRQDVNELTRSIETTILDEGGNTYAVIHGTWEKSSFLYSYSQIQFSTEAVGASGTTKAIFLSFLAMLKIMEMEKYTPSGSWFVVYLLLFVSMIFNMILMISIIARS